MQHIEGMEELLLSAFLSYYKLHIIHHQYVHGSVFFPQLGHGRGVSVSYGLYDLVGELFAGNVKHLLVRGVL